MFVVIVVVYAVVVYAVVIDISGVVEVVWCVYVAGYDAVVSIRAVVEFVVCIVVAIEYTCCMIALAVAVVLTCQRCCPLCWCLCFRC